jgi:glycosyltransferase involved in cell wall biosynthesis
MIKQEFKKQITFVVPTLSESSAQNEDIVQLLLFASVQLEQELKCDRDVAVTIISVEHETDGWKHLSTLFSEEALKHVSVEKLKEPKTPNLAIAQHKPAYDLFEFLKNYNFHQIHFLDRYGLAYYPTLAKHLGLYFLNTIFIIHLVGGTIFRRDAEDNLVSDVGALMDDMLERGSLERADAICVHDRKAWRWYSDKIEVRNDTSVYDLAWPKETAHLTELELVDPGVTPAIIYYGPLGAEGGLPLFCDAVSRMLLKFKRPLEVFFVGSPQAIGGMDAVSYIHLRCAKWTVPIAIKRDLAISDEIAFICERPGIVFSYTVRRDGIRSRLIESTGLQILKVENAQVSRHYPNIKTCPAVPVRIAETMVKLLVDRRLRVKPQIYSLSELWASKLDRLPDIEDINPSPPLQIPGDNQPKVSVCITHFCRPQKLRKALASLEQQTYKNFEVIVVDDGSPDREVKNELKKIKHEIEPLGWQLLHQDNQYLGAARNFGARHATGEYLLFMDDDNIAKSNEISTLVSVAQRTGADIVTAFCDVFNTEEDIESRKEPKMRFTPFGSDPALGILSNCYGDANALYSRKIFYKLGGFTVDYGITHEDWEFFCRASLEGVKMVCVPEPLFWYRVDPCGMFRGEHTRIHKSANLRRHIRPFLEKLPHYQAKLVRLVQGLTADLPETTVGSRTRAAAVRSLKSAQDRMPYARVAVIMRTKDRPLLLQRGIRSVLHQNFGDWLLVIVNDGGDPMSIELLVEEFAAELSGRLLVLHHPISLGMQSAANAGINSCDSDFIIIHDDDDTWDPSFLARTVSLLDEQSWDPKIGGVVTWSQVIIEELANDGQILIYDRFIFNDKLRGISLRDLAVENRFPPISFLFRRTALETVGPFKEQHGPLGDWEFHMRVLQRFNIEVIPEPLANYHHRLKSTVGVYSNSVHSQSNLHQSKRVELLNSTLRKELAENDGITHAELLAIGDLQSALIEEQSKEFQKLHDYIWSLEQRIKFIASQFDTSANVNFNRNLIINGDFRLWPGLGRVQKIPSEKYVFSKICSDFYICYNEHQMPYQVEQRKWIEEDRQLPYGKTYLHIDSGSDTTEEAWVILEWIIPSVSLLSGHDICISGFSRLMGSQDHIFVGGRYHLGDGRKLDWPDQMVTLPFEFAQWSCSISCPSVEETEVSRGHNSRILLKIQHELPFAFDLTNFQVELGTTPTEFEYQKTNSLRDRLAVIWHKSGLWFRNGQRYRENHIK